MTYKFGFLCDRDKQLLDIFIVGSIIAYVSILFNIAVFVILCRKNLYSPATILMQGLAVADCLTALSSYGLEPLFQLWGYNFVYGKDLDFIGCYLIYPYCSVAVHMSILSLTFHAVSNMITTCLGLQKVIAIMYPIWTRCHLTNRKSIMCCVVCFLLSITFSFPRHFALDIIHDENVSQVCMIYTNGVGIIEYSSIYYLLIQTALITCCCLVMLMSTIYITYKLVTNSFRGRVMTERKRQERKSVIMVFLVLIIFLISEVPKVGLYIFFDVNYIAGHFPDTDRWGFWLILRYEDAMAWLLTQYTDLFEGTLNNRSIDFMFVMEYSKLCTLFGCISNFIIYILLSWKLRKEIITVFQKLTRRSKNAENVLHETNQNHM